MTAGDSPIRRVQAGPCQPRSSFCDRNFSKGLGAKSCNFQGNFQRPASWFRIGSRRGRRRRRAFLFKAWAPKTVTLAASRRARRTTAESTVAPSYQILWVPGFRGHTISRPELKLFNPLRRHLAATCGSFKPCRKIRRATTRVLRAGPISVECDHQPAGLGRDLRTSAGGD